MTLSHSGRCWNALYMYDFDLLRVWSGWGASIITYSMLQVRDQVNLLLLPLWCETKHISGWGCVLMPTSHSGRCWSALYMYDFHLLRVWSGWGASIITYSMLQVRDQVNLLLLQLWCETKHISGWGCVLMPTSHSGRCWSALYMYDFHLLRVWSGWGASIITYSMLQVRDQVNLLCCYVTPSTYQVEVVSSWPLATVEDAEAHYICMKLTWYEYEVGGVPQS